MERFTVTVVCGSSPGLDPICLDAARAAGSAVVDELPLATGLSDIDICAALSH